MGGYNFSLLSDDDEQKKLEEQQNILQQLIGDDSPTSAVDHTPSQLAASATDPDVADFRARLSQAQSSREQNSGGDLGPLEELVRQHEHRSHTAGDVDTGLAMLLDVVANRGRGLGQITGAYVSNRDAEDRQGEALQKDLAMAQARRKSGQDPVADLLRQQALENGIRGLQERDKQVTGVQARAEHNWAQNESPEAAKQTTAVEVAKRKAAAGVEGKTSAETELADQIDENARGKASATAQGSTSATTNELRLNPRDITPEQQAQLDIETKRLQQSQQAHEDAQANAEATRAATAETHRQGELNSFRTQTKDMLVALQKARELQSQIDKTPGKVAGLDNLSYNEPNLMLDRQAIHNQEILQQLINPETKRYFGTAVSANEASARERAYGTGRLSGEAAREEAIKTIREGLESGVRGAAAGREAIAAEVLKEYPGLENLITVPDAAPDVRNAMPQVRPAVPEGDTLPVTRGAVPKASDITGGGDARSKQSYRLRSPSGKTGTMQLSDEELQKLEAKGFQVL